MKNGRSRGRDGLAFVQEVAADVNVGGPRFGDLSHGLSLDIPAGRRLGRVISDDLAEATMFGID